MESRVTHLVSLDVCKSCKSVLLYVSMHAQATGKGFALVQTKEVSMRPEDVHRVFGDHSEGLLEWIAKGKTSLLVSVNAQLMAGVYTSKYQFYSYSMN